MIPIAEPWLGEEELNNVIAAVKSGWISSKGEFIPQFEQRFAQYCGVKHGVATSNGTVALHLALAALGIKEGDEVIVPALTFVATANAVRYTGAEPVFVDSRPDYWCIDPEKIEDAITAKTKAIISVHLYGHPCDMDPIMDIARRKNLYVIEDAAEAHGAEYKGKKTGSFGDISCFSFYGNKIITTGEGGMCLTDDDTLAEKMNGLRDHGMNPQRRYWHESLGFNYRMTNLQAAVGAAQINKLGQFVTKKREIAQQYGEGLKELAEKGLIKLHPEMPWAKCVYWMYSILVGDVFIGRDDLAERLEKVEIETRPFFYPVHVLPMYKSKAVFLVAQDLSKRGINLPSGIKLTEAEIVKVATTITELASEDNGAR